MSQDICSAYVLRFSGFNDPDNVTYFAPYQSAVDNPDGFALGWVQKEITMNGETKSSLTPVAYYSGFQSFAIMVDGAYPWLDADADIIYKRKQELELKEIDRQLKEYRKIAQNDKRVIILDATKEPSKIVEEAISHIFSYYMVKL